MRKHIIATFAVVACLLGGGFVVTNQFAGAAPAAVTAAAKAPSQLCAKSGPRDLKVYEGCPSGYFPAQLPISAIAGLSDALASRVGVVAPASSPVRVVHKTMTVDADFQAGTLAERTVTITGVPAYRSSSSPVEIFGSNASDVNLPATATVGAADISVLPVAGPAGTATVGATERKFVVSPVNFTGSRIYQLDIWVLVIVA